MQWHEKLIDVELKSYNQYFYMREDGLRAMADFHPPIRKNTDLFGLKLRYVMLDYFT